MNDGRILETAGPSVSKAVHPGISLWRDIYEKGHWVVPLFRRWYLHYYDHSEPRHHHWYWLRRDLYTSLNDGWPEFKRVLPFTQATPQPPRSEISGRAEDGDTA